MVIFELCFDGRTTSLNIAFTTDKLSFNLNGAEILLLKVSFINVNIVNGLFFYVYKMGNHLD